MTTKKLSTPDHLLKLQLLGRPQLRLGGQSLNDKISGRPLALLIYLAVTALPHTRDVLADLLWANLDNQQARNNLRYLLPELRKMFGDYLAITTKSISFNQQQPYYVDAEVLRSTLTAPAATVSTQRLHAAVDLYQGEFLAGFSIRQAPVFEEWVTMQRENMHQLAIQGLSILAERYQSEGNIAAGLRTTQRLLQLEPWHEAGHYLQMQLLAAHGQRSIAIAHYHHLRQKLATDLGIEPTIEIKALYTQLSNAKEVDKGPDTPHQPSVTPVAMSGTGATTPTAMHNLPGQLTTFVGRQEEITDLCTRLLTTDSRLITLIGEGGIGKTRLALAVAQAILESNNPQAQIKNQKFVDGVWFIPLVGITADREGVDLLAIAVAQAIGLQFSSHQPLLTQLLTYLQHKTLLLLFDNAEHLLPTFTDFLLQLLQGCPKLTALITSRHVLNLQAEFIWWVDRLPVPSTAELAQLTPSQLIEYGSIALFIERARRVNRNFEITPENQSLLVAICHLVVGLPLALELAAALTKRYTCAELYEAIQGTYTILTTTFADVAPRHRSIGAVLDYSWQFLTPEEARLLAVCAIFPGGFTGAAATQVMGATPAVLTSLMNQSLLQMNGDRFTLHELVRQYATDRLAQSPEVQHNAFARHAAYYMDLLHSLEAALLSTVDAQAIVQSELDNIRTAWHWCTNQSNLTLLALGLESLQSFYRLAGLNRSAIHLLELTLTTVRQANATRGTIDEAPDLLVRLLCHTAQFYRCVGDVESGERLAQEALQLGQQLADPALVALAYHELARFAQVRSDFLTMYKLSEQSCTQARQAGLPQLIAECLNDLGIAVSTRMHPLTAIPHFYEALQWLQGGSNRYLEARVLGNMGFFHLSCHEYHLACRYLQQAFALQCLLQDEGRMITQLFLGNLWMAIGLYDQADQEYAQALTSMQTIQNPYWKSWLYTSYGHLQHLRGNPVAAHAACTLAQQMIEQEKSHIQEQWVQIDLGHALTALQQWEAARHYYEQAIALHEQSSWVYRTADAHAGLAALLLTRNEPVAALVHSEAALAILAQQGVSAAQEPFTIYWTCICTFRANGDPRAVEVLRTANQLLQTVAAKFEDERLRDAFLQQVVVNRQLMAAGAATTGVL